ncbi:MAG: BlaI/MecI/CopY family transcriptional regulator [Gemmatimonadaceae bacterium]|nr:BlaI/MecI/CopY family transcriptional regulator [Gloeobacterales cyanobacterium ES-bin-141]
MENALIRTNRLGLKKLLGDQEAEIMEQVWAMGGEPVLARQVHERMPGGERLAYSTVVCTMGRLATKGLLKVIDATTKPYLYLPTLTREQFVDRTVGKLLEALAADFPLAVSRFLRPGDEQPPETVVQAILEAEE